MTNGIENDINQVVRDLNTLNFEEDEEEMYNVIDLPKHACAYQYYILLFFFLNFLCNKNTFNRILFLNDQTFKFLKKKN